MQVAVGWSESFSIVFSSYYYYYKCSKTFLSNMIWECSILSKIIHMCCTCPLIADSEFLCRWPSLFQNINDAHHYSSRKAFKSVTVIKCLRNCCRVSAGEGCVIKATQAY